MLEMSRKNLLFILGFVCLFTVSHAQISSQQLSDSIQSVNAAYADTMSIVSADIADIDRITQYADDNMNQLIEIQRNESLRKKGVDGYRVQIFQGNKADAFKTKADFMQKYPNCNVYVLFITPDFRVRVGDFRTRSEAIKTKYSIEKDFPNPYIVDDIINFPELKTNNLQ